MNQGQRFDKTRQYPRHPCAHRNGGYHMNLDDETKLKSIIGSVMKQIGSKMAKGDFNLATISKPIVLTHPLSSIECLCFDYYYHEYLNIAATTYDPLKRMQLVATASIASIHKTQSILKTSAPIDCVIGETCQKMHKDGSQFYAEFIKTDPPTALFQIYGPNNQWKITGVDEVHAEISPTFTVIQGKNPRAKSLKFNDGKEYIIQVPNMIIEGVLVGDRILNFQGSYKIICPKDKLQAIITFSYKYVGKVSKLKNKLTFWSQNEQILSDLVNVQINKLISMDEDDDDDEQVFTLSSGSGSWLSYIQFDDEVLWRIDDQFSPWFEPKHLIPSDSTFRLDRKYMLLNQNDLAQESRNQIEEQDGKDQKLRKQKKK
ncbi:hypothetical protein pb186bvf_000217 [Paramecium bursaria]